MTPGASPMPVAPDSVHVWRGFRSPAKSFDDFQTFLGTVFLPACALLQPNAGLRAYVPSMPKQEGKPSTVPDQTALMFWTVPQQHEEAFKTVAVRAYTNLHGDAYGPGSSAQFPIPLGDEVKAEQPYYLVDKPADWMLGRVQHLVGARPDGHSAEDFLSAVHAWGADVASAPPDGLEAGLLCAGEKYVVAWLLWNADAQGSDALAELAKKTTPSLDRTATTYVIPAGLWDDWPGIDLTNPSCLNIQLVRPGRVDG